MSQYSLVGIKQSSPGVQALPDREGNVKTCISGQSYVCGKACLGIGSNVTPECNRGLNAANIEKANQLSRVLIRNRNAGVSSIKNTEATNTKSSNPTPVTQTTPTPPQSPTKSRSPEPQVNRVRGVSGIRLSV